MRIALVHAAPMAVAPVAAAARRLDAQGFGAVMLAQFSMAPARDAVQAAVRCPVLTSPGSAVRKLKRLLS